MKDLSNFVQGRECVSELANTRGAMTGYAREKARVVYLHFYLTLVSIICSLDLTYLLLEFDYNRLKEMGVVYCLEASGTFLLIYIIWYEIVMTTVLFNWVIGHSDSLLVFAVGIVMFFAVNAMNKSLASWLFVGVVYSLVSIGCLMNIFMKARKEPGGREALRRLRHTWTIVFAAAAVPVSGVLSILAKLYSRVGYVQVMCAVEANLNFIGYLVLTHFLRRHAFAQSPEIDPAKES